MSETSNAIQRKNNRAGIIRRQKILDVAKRVFIEKGYAGFTSRHIAREVGISIGNLQYFFSNKEQLLLSMLEKTVQNYDQEYEVVTENLPPDPKKKFIAILDYLLNDICNPDTRSFFFELWALSTKQKYAAKMMEDFYASHIRNMKKFVKEIYPDYSDETIEYKAVQFAALIEGMMIFTDKYKASAHDFTALKEDTKKTILKIIEP
jgi:AcrR family transcriptional regulator